MTGEVIVPSFTFVATAHALQWQHVTPVFCDIEPSKHLVDPQRMEEMVTPRTTGILGVHLWGRACEVDAIMDIARRHNLKVLFDAAHAFGCTYKGRRIGCFGDAEVFSFHATKFLNSFEGGAVVTNDDDLAKRIRLLKNFGFSGYDQVTSIGTNGKMTEVAAAMGLTSLESLDTFIAVNRRNYELYNSYLHDLPGIRLLTFTDEEKYNYQYIVLEVDEAQTRISRDELMRVLWAENVIARRYFYPGCHRMEPYRSSYPQAGTMLPVTEMIAQRVLSLPTNTAVGRLEIETICDIVRSGVANGRAIHARLRGNEDLAAGVTERRTGR